MRRADRLIQQQLVADSQRLAVATNLPAPGMAVVTVDDRLHLSMGQGYPNLVTGQQWPMSNNALYYAVQGLLTQVAGMQLVQTAQQALLTAFAAGADRQSAQVSVLTSQLQLAQSGQQTLQAGQAAAELRLAAVEAKATLTASATEANRLDIVALKAADVVLQTRAGTDETAIAAAQATANQARADAATAQKKADDDATALLAVQAQALAAQNTATAAQQAQAAFAAKFRSQRVTLPQIPLSGYIDVVVTFAAYVDTNFTAIAEPAGLTLLGLDATELATARTSSSATFRIKNVLGLLIAAGGQLDFLAYHD